MTYLLYGKFKTIKTCVLLKRESNGVNKRTKISQWCTKLKQFKYINIFYTAFMTSFNVKNYHIFLFPKILWLISHSRNSVYFLRFAVTKGIFSERGEYLFSISDITLSRIHFFASLYDACYQHTRLSYRIAGSIKHVLY